MTPRITVSRVIDTAPYRAALPARITPKYRDVHNDVGTHSVSFLNSDGDAAAITETDVLAYSVDGQEQFWGLVDKIRSQTVAQDEEIAETTSYEGSGVLNELAHSLVYSYLDRQPVGDVRYFDFSEPKLNDGDWTAAVERFIQCEAPGANVTPPNGLFGAPIGFPDGNAQWIAPRPLSGDRDPIGTWYTRKYFTVEADTELVIYAAGDDTIDMRIDGQPIIEWDEPPGYDGWHTTRFARIKATAGSHVLSAKIKNYDRSDTPSGNTGNISVFICAVYQMSNTWLGNIQTLVCHTDDTWLVKDYPTEPPGFTPLEILAILLQEAKDRGGLLNWQVTWPITVESNLYGDAIRGEEDSGGNTCARTPDITVRYGASLLDVCKQLAEGWAEFAAHMNAGSATRYLDMWASRGFNGAPGRGVDASYTITVGVNAVEIDHDIDTSKMKTQILGRDESGYFEVANPRFLGGPYPRREGFLSLNDQKERLAARRTAAASAEQAVTIQSITVTQWAETAADAPGNAYSVGDRIWAPDRSGASTQYRVVGVSVDEPATGKLLVVPELESSLQDQNDQFERWMRRTAHGTLDGRSEAATPGPIKTIESGTVPDDYISWSQPSTAYEADGTPYAVKVPFRGIKLTVSCSELDDEVDAAASSWVILRDGTVVDGITIPAGVEEYTECIPLGLFAVIGQKLNAAVVTAGHHKNMTLRLDYVRIGSETTKR